MNALDTAQIISEEEVKALLLRHANQLRADFPNGYVSVNLGLMIFSSGKADFTASVGAESLTKHYCAPSFEEAFAQIPNPAKLAEEKRVLAARLLAEADAITSPMEVAS